MAKILIIDDEVQLVEMMKMRLEAEGYEIIMANDGLQATMMAHKEKPDLIILDLILPVGGGISALRNLKMSVHTRGIPVIVVSGTGDNELKDEVESLGVADFVQKPYDANDLISRIQTALPNKKIEK